MPTALPQISTPRLLLQALEMSQAETLFSLVNEPTIADNTANIPSPYTLEVAQTFIAQNTVRTDCWAWACTCAKPVN